MYDLVHVHSSIAASQTKVASVLPLVRFQTRRVRSQERGDRRWPSVEIATAATNLVWRSRMRGGCFPYRSHIRSVQS